MNRLGVSEQAELEGEFLCQVPVFLQVCHEYIPCIVTELLFILARHLPAINQILSFRDFLTHCTSLPSDPKVMPTRSAS